MTISKSDYWHETGNRIIRTYVRNIVRKKLVFMGL